MAVQPKSFTTLPKGYVTTRQVAKRMGIQSWKVDAILRKHGWAKGGRPSDWAYEKDIAVHLQRSPLENPMVLWHKVYVPRLIEIELGQAGGD